MQLAGASGASLLAYNAAARTRVQESKANSEPVAPSTAKAESTGPRDLFAVVGRDGKLERGHHAVSAKRLGAGIYEVTFSRDVRRGVYLATVGGPGFAGVPLAATAAVMGRATTPRGVLVYTTNLTSDPIDCGFHLLVVCPEGYA